MLAAINHVPTAQALACERAFLGALDGSCRTPIAGHAVVDGDRLSFNGLILTPDGKRSHRRFGRGLCRRRRRDRARRRRKGCAATPARNSSNGWS